MIGTTRFVHGFSPGDVSSIAAAVAAAHIGKPPPFHCKSLYRTVAVEKDSTENLSNFENHSNIHQHNNFVIGKPPPHRSDRAIPFNITPDPTLEKINRYAASDDPTIEVSIDRSTDTSSSDFQSSETSNIHDIVPHDLGKFLRTSHKRWPILISEQQSKKDIIQNSINYDDDNDAVEGISVPAVFCGYKATPEELLRLRSAQIIV
jgi:hypothetical protein